MKRKKIFPILLIIIFSTACSSSSDSGAKEKVIREPAVSGQFYPEKPGKLNRMVDKYLTGKPENKNLNLESISGLIVPHAGYIYSGTTAGKTFSTVKDKSFKTVVLLGPSHHYKIDNLTACRHDEWKTPLGNTMIDKNLNSKIIEKTGARVNNEAFKNEHSLELQLPFLRNTLKGNFKIVPLLTNDLDLDNIQKTAKLMAKILKKHDDILIVMSTDMSHYFPLEKAKKMDQTVIKTIEEYNLARLEKLLKNRTGQLCGGAAVMLGMQTLKLLGTNRAINVDYSHSGEISGNNSEVVGYGGFVMTGKKNEKKETQYRVLTDSQQKQLLNIARETLENYVRKDKKPRINTGDEDLQKKRGVFVTLNKQNQLRGCIGHIFPVDKLYKSVIDMTVSAASEDPRFNPVQPEELEDINIEISVLTVPEEVSGADKIKLGRDGVIVKKGMRQGVYLPQVAEETGWSKEKFLSSLCSSKAGLSPDAWKKKTTKLLTFRAQVFSEEKNY
ncbi:MAG: AmmeMemoRadiSam system protein B [Elusimicrobiota bacterium]